jgi:hypothetical protein
MATPSPPKPWERSGGATSASVGEFGSLKRQRKASSLTTLQASQAHRLHQQQQQHHHHHHQAHPIHRHCQSSRVRSAQLLIAMRPPTQT